MGVTITDVSVRDNLCDVSVVVPVYGSRDTLPHLIDRLSRTLHEAKRSFEIVLVDDGSRDDSWDVALAIRSQSTERIVLIQLMRNFGQHNALMAGFRQASGRYIVTIDDDLQHPPEEVLRLLAAIESTGHDLVYGVPRGRQHKRWRNFGSALVTWFYRFVFGTRATPSAFRIMHRELVEAILTYDMNYTYIDGLLAWNTQRIGEVEVQHDPRAVGCSGYSIRKLVVLALNLFTSFSLLPLQFVSFCGFGVAVCGCMIGVYYLLLALSNAIDVPGYASTIVAIFVLGGLQLMALGVLGEYLGRLHLSVNRKPQYTLRRISNPVRPQEPKTIDVFSDIAAAQSSPDATCQGKTSVTGW